MRNHPYDKLKDHNYEKGIFKSPINQIENVALYSWRNDCLPDFIWVALILDYYGREEAFLTFSGVSARPVAIHRFSIFLTPFLMTGSEKTIYR